MIASLAGTVIFSTVVFVIATLLAGPGGVADENERSDSETDRGAK